ncbi:hypothetical protein KSS87_011422 [Heliosperma pusillum]|nr:hypothetical protein KSS87_011422 [Heliosperma pusillum]
MGKEEEAVLGIPYNPAQNMGYHQHQHHQQQPPPQQQQYYYPAPNPYYQNGAVPPNAIFDDPKGVPITQTIYRDTPAPFSCVGEFEKSDMCAVMDPPNWEQKSFALTG